MVTYQEWKAKKAENSQKNTEPKVVNKRAASIKQGYEDWKKRKAEQGDLLTSQQRNERNSFQESWGENSKNIDRYLQESSNYLQNARKNFYSDGGRETVQNLRSQGMEYLNYLNQNGKYMDEQTRRNISDALRSIDFGYTSTIRLYSNFDTEDDYLKWEAYSTTENRQERYEQNQKRLSELEAEKIKVQNDMNTFQPGTNPYTYGGYSVSGAGYGAAAQNFASGNSGPQAEKLNALNDEINSIKREMTMYERGGTDADTGFYYGSKVVDDYSAYLNDPNYGQFSAEDFRNPTKDDLRYYDAMMDQSTWYQDGSGNTRNRMGDIVTESVYADDPRYQIADPLGAYLQATPEDLANMHGDGSTQLGVLNQLLMDGYYGSWDQLDESEREIYYTLLGTQGKEAAMKYLSDMETELNRRNMAQESELYKLAFERANGWQRLGMSAVSIPANLLGGATAFVDDLSHTVRGEDINPYSAAHQMQNYGQQVRANQAAAFDESSSWEIPGIGFSAGDLYQAAMSTADMFGGAMIGPTAYGALMGMGAASSEARRLYEMGASKDQIFWGSAAAGAAEMVFEKFSIEKLIDIKDADTLGKLVLNALKQGGIEASEEGATELANLITNNLIMTSESDWAKLIEANNGDVGAATWAAIGQIGSAVASGFVSGFMGGTGSATMNYAQNYAQNYRNDMDQGKAIQEGDGLQSLRDLAMAMAEKENGKTQAALRKQSDRLGKEFVYDFTRDRAAGRLYRTVQNTVSEANKADVAKALQEQGYTQRQAKNIADAFYAQAIGMEVSKAQQKVIQEFGKNEDVQKIIGDMLLSSESTIAKRNQDLQNFRLDVIKNQLVKKLEESTGEKIDLEEMDTAEEIDDSAPSLAVSEDGSTRIISTGKVVNITGFAKSKDGKAMLRIDTGEVVAADDISYANDSDALIYETIANLGVPVSNANGLLSAYKGKSADDAEIFARGIKEAFQYGQMGIPMAEMTDSAFASKLSEFQMEYAYKQGKAIAYREQARVIADREQAKVSKYNTEENRAKLKNKAESKGKYKKVTFEGDVRLNTKRKTEIEFIDYIASKFSGNRVHVYESYRDENGNYVYKDSNGKVHKAPNGKYVNNEIWLDLNAGDMGEGLILNTFSHEMYHHIKKWSPKKAQLLAEFLVEELGMESVDIMVANQIAKAEAAGHGVAWFMKEQNKTQEQAEKVVRDRAMEDFVADSLETMFTRGDIAAELARLNQADTGLFNEIRNFINKWVKEIKAFYSNRTTSREGDIVAHLESFEKIQRMFAEAVVEAGENYQTTMQTEKNAAISGNKKVTDKQQMGYAVEPEFGDMTEGYAEEDIGAMYSGRNKKSRASNHSPLTRRSVKQRSSSGTHTMMTSTAAARILGISNIDEYSDSVKMAISALGEIYVSVDDSKPIPGRKRPVSGSTLEGMMIALGILQRGGTSGSAYRKDGDHELRVSNHSAHSENFKGAGEHLSIALFRKGAMNKFLDSENSVVEAVFRVDYLDKHKDTLKALIQDIARFIASGEYHDTAGAHWYNISGSEEFKQQVRKRLEKDAEARAAIEEKFSDRDYASYDRTAILKESRVDEYLMEYGAKNSSKYAKAYIATMRPESFLKLTTESSRERGHIIEEAGTLDKEKLGKSRPGIYLRINRATGTVIGHEGRHRMAAMDAAGIYNVPVVIIDDSNNFQKTDMTEMDLRGQFNRYESGYAYDLIPLSFENRDRIIQKYATQTAHQSVGERIGYSETLRFSDRSPESVSNRSILANAFDGVAQTDYERQKLQEYRDNITAKDAEEQKLRHLRDQIRELSFARGPRDKQKLSKLREEAQKTENRLNIYDKRLLRLEAAKPLMDVLEREKQKAYDRAVKKGKDRIEKSVEKQNKAELRKKIRKTIRDLDKLFNRGDKKRNVKEGLRDVVDYALESAEILFTDTYTVNDMIHNGFKADLSEEERKWADEAKDILEQLDNIPDVNKMDNITEWMQKETDLKKRLSDLKSNLKNAIERERNFVNGQKVSDILTNLANAYRQITESEDSYIRGAYDADVYERLLSISTGFGTTKAVNMSLDQLDELLDAYKMVLTIVRNANKMFAENIKESRDLLAAKVMMEVRKAGGEKHKWTKAGKAVNSFSWNNEKPIYAFERIGSAALTNLYHNIRKGQDTWAIDIMQADVFRRKLYKKYDFDGWDMEKGYEFTSSSGAKFSLNLQQIMSLYAYSKREQAHDHLLKGGFVFDVGTEVVENKLGVPVTYMVEDATAYNLSVDILKDIVSKLSTEQKSFVDEMQNYLSTTMGNKGNEVSMQLYGINLFKEKNYFPLRSAGQYMERAREANLKKEQGQVSLVSSGFTKSTTPKASNPVVLSDFMDVWAGHVNEMSNYHAFVLPMEDFRRVYNYSTPHAEGEQSASVNEAIQNAYGTAATAYIDQLYRDLNGGALSDSRENLAKRMMGLFKKGSVMASWSVVFQQPSSIGRAFALVDLKYFTPAPITNRKQRWEELKKYAPVAMIKEMGYFDTGMGQNATEYLQAEEYDTMGEKVKGFFTDSNYRYEILTRPAAVADEITWLQIWNAVKNETADKHPGMNRTSEAFLKLAGERFSEVIDKTQVYDSVLARSGNMRSKSLYMNIATAFMAEPTTSINMIEDAIRKGFKGNKKQAARTMAAVATSVVINSALASIIYAARDDDEDETYAEKYISSFVTKTMDGFNPIIYYPFLKDIWSAFQGYDIERSDMSVIVDLVDTLKGLTQIYAKDTSNMDDDQLAEHKKQTMDAWLKALDSITALGGIPLRNVRRDLNGAINMYTTIKTDVEGRQTTAASLADVVRGDIARSLPVIGWMPAKSRNEKLYDAITSGDDAYAERLQSGYKSEEAYHSAIRKALRDYDPRIREAAIASNGNDYETYLDVVEEIMDEGHFDRDDVIKAIRSEASALAPEEGSGVSNAQSLMTAEQFAIAVANGDNDVAKIAMDDIIATAQENGKTESEAVDSFHSSAKSALKDQYLVDTLSGTNAEKALVAFCGMDTDEAAAAVRKWEFESKSGFAYGDMRQEFLAGNITAAEAEKYLQTYGGKTADEAAETIKEWEFEKKNGYVYSDRKNAFLEGKVSASALRRHMMEYDGMSAAEADNTIRAYEWMKRHPQYDMSVDDVIAYTKPIEKLGYSIESYSIKPEVFIRYKDLARNATGVDSDGYGKVDTGSKKAEILEIINALPLTAKQKDALYYLNGWAASNLRKAPWH